MQPLDIFFNSIDELSLVLLDGSADLMDRLATRHVLQTSASYLRANKKGVEL